MLILDDILTFPFRGLQWVFEEIHDAAVQELDQEADTITADLQQLYLMLENGSISEAEFDRREAKLLDALDRIQ
ncbi:MAG: gas vesicle protein GvpG [Pseudomonadota bacterium]